VMVTTIDNEGRSVEIAVSPALLPH